MGASELPHNRRQVYNQQASARKSDKVDELVQQCKADLMPGGGRFVRSVNFDTSPSHISTVNDVVRFCTTPGELHVCSGLTQLIIWASFMTLSLHLLIPMVISPLGNRPPFWALYLCILSKLYYTFFSTLLKLEPKLANIVAVGTDGEKAIVKALKAVFPDKVVYLRCFLHMKDANCPSFSYQRVSEDIIKDLFGTQQGSTYVKGALDASSCADF